MRRLILPLVVVVGIVAAAILLIGHSAPPATAGAVTQLHVELSANTASGKLVPQVGGVPPNCSSWHELYPAFCAEHHQDGYTDNGDGVVSACDIIILDGTAYHIVWAGPTYWTTCDSPGLPPTTVVYEPTQPSTGQNPICQIWHEVYPNFCNQIHIDSWHDNGNGVLDVCDVVDTQGDAVHPPMNYHIDRIECDITIEPIHDPVKPSTWTEIKNFLNGLF